MHIHEFHESLKKFNLALTIEDVRVLCVNFVKHLGFDSFVYALRITSQLSESKLIVITTYPDTWIDHYFSNQYALYDPVMEYCKKHVVPVQWHDIDCRNSRIGLRVMKEAGEFGLKNGITVPVHAPNGELAIFSMSLNRDLPTSKAITSNSLPFIQLLATYLHEAVRRVSDLDGVMGLNGGLSFREQECLRWVADGKTSWEISMLLKVSERTVNFHLKNATTKLHVFSRQHAAVKALVKGYIHPKPF